MHVLDRQTDKTIVLNLCLAWFEAMKRSPKDDRDSSSRDFLSFLIFHITPQPLLAYVNQPNASERF